MTERQIPDRDPGLPPDPGPSSDPEVGAAGTDLKDFEGGSPDETEPEGDHEKAREARRNIDEVITQLPPD